MNNKIVGILFLLFSGKNLTLFGDQEPALEYFHGKFGSIEDFFFQVDFSLLVEETKKQIETKSIEKIRERNVYWYF